MKCLSTVLISHFHINRPSCHTNSTEEIIISVTSLTKSSGTFSTKLIPLADTSKDLACSHIITPVVFVLLSNRTWRGKSLSVLVIGQTMASLVKRLKTLLLITKAGLLLFPKCFLGYVPLGYFPIFELSCTPHAPLTSVYTRYLLMLDRKMSPCFKKTHFPCSSQLNLTLALPSCCAHTPLRV